ncbi:MAG TPA: alpha-L-rhamnosidase C-terminal domain-containing protein [bacterium]|mgnify:CR=1 FL=1|nr:alpha-L-rhamnosidase C-terminal domain-containing protein [bacterium]
MKHIFKNHLFFIFVFLLSIITSVEISCLCHADEMNGNELQPFGLMIELMAMPDRTVIFDPNPEFSWIVPGTARGVTQSAYMILVASAENLLDEQNTDMWNTGMTDSNSNTAVEYAGKPLEPGRDYFWKVRTWDNSGNASEWSAPQHFIMGGPDTDSSDRHTSPRYPLVETEVPPAAGAKTGTGAYFVDFGKAAFGTVKFSVSGDMEPGSIKVVLGEERGPGKKINMFPAANVRYREMRIDYDPQVKDYRAVIEPDKRNTRPEAIHMPDYIGEVLPFRYCELKGFKSGAKPANVKQVRVHYPFDDDAAAFTSSDPVLNDVWELSKYSIKATSFAGVYVDGDRERIPYEADAYINQLGHYGVDREFTLARYSHEYLIQHPTWPTEWALHSVLIAWADYMHTGDTDSLAGFYDDLKTKTLAALARDDGLISSKSDKLSRDFYKSLHMVDADGNPNSKMADVIDWPPAERDGFVVTDFNTAVNAFHYRAIVLMNKIATVLGKYDDAALFRSHARLVRDSFNKAFFNPETGLYVDGEGSNHSSLHASMFPLAMGLVPEENRPAIIDFIKSKGMACSVYAAQYLLDALYDNGEEDYALSLITDRETDRSWPHMIYDVGTTITLEAWDIKYKNNLDWNHAWGAAPANIIPRKLMGIEPLEPGFSKVKIAPRPGNLKQAGITTPTIRGPVKLDYSVGEDAARRYDVCLPSNMQAEIHLPAADRNSVTESGKPVDSVGDVEFLRYEGDRSVFGVTSGCYSFTVSR